MDYKEAKNRLINIEIAECENFFKQNDYPLEYGYCKLLKGELNEARKIFTPIRDIDLRADWAYLLIQFMNNYIQFMPSYLQVRNFLEIDIALILKAGLTEYVENIINACDIFYEINQESYKFIARVMLNYDLPTAAKIFLNKGMMSLMSLSPAQAKSSLYLLNGYNDFKTFIVFAMLLTVCAPSKIKLS